MKKYLLQFLSVLAISLMTISLKAQCSLVAGFTATPDSVGSMNYTLTGNWQGGNPSFTYFSINNGSSIYGSNVTYTFPAGGTYTVCFYVTDSTNFFPSCTAYFCDTITVGATGSCGAYITATNNGGGNYTMTATPNSPSNWTVSYNWNFGDGSTSTANPANHTYSNNGTYYVSVLTTATDPGNPANTCSGTTYLTLTVQGGSNTSGNMSCQANFTSSNSGNTFSFNNTSYTSDSVAASSSVWTLDGLQFSTLANPTYTVSDSLMHVVCLTQHYINLTTGDSCYSTFCDSVGLGGNPGGGGSNTCQAGFIIWQDTLNLSTYYGYNTSVGGPNTTYLWDFGDGTTSNSANPTHQYANPGIYTVCLTIVDANCTSTHCDSAGVYKMMNPGMSQLIILPSNPQNGVSSVSKILTTDVRPNPLTDESTLTIEISEADQVSFILTDLSGRKVLNQILALNSGVNTFKLPSTELSHGIYFLSITDHKFIHRTIKLVK